MGLPRGDYAMSSIVVSPNIAQVKPEEVRRFVDLFCTDVARVVNGGLDFKTNFNAQTISVTFSAANSSQAFGHGLGRIPIGYIQVGSTAAMNVFDGTSKNTTGTINLQSSAAGTA